MTEFFLQRYRQIDSAVELPELELKQALRVNPKKLTPEELKKQLTQRGVMVKKIDFLKNGYYASADFSLGSTKEYLLGWYYLQNPLSQLACEILNPGKDDIVLDMAAAPGGKTTYLAEMAKMVVALDNHPDRLRTVTNNVERLGLTNVICILKDARFASDLNEKFSHVLLDAPCAGNYCQQEGWFEKRTLDDIKKNARLQKELFRAAHQCLEEDGKLLYSTCSLEPEENELIIDWALEKYKDLEIIPLDTELGDAGATSWEGKELKKELTGTKRFWPHKTGMEGFYMALLKKC